MINPERYGAQVRPENQTIADSYLRMLSDLLVRRRNLNYGSPDELEYIIDKSIVAIAQECFDENAEIKAKSLIATKAPRLLQSTLSNVRSYND